MYNSCLPVEHTHWNLRQLHEQLFTVSSYLQVSIIFDLMYLLMTLNVVNCSQFLQSATVFSVMSLPTYGMCWAIFQVGYRVTSRCPCLMKVHCRFKNTLKSLTSTLRYCLEYARIDNSLVGNSSVSVSFAMLCSTIQIGLPCLYIGDSWDILYQYADAYLYCVLSYICF